MSIEIRDAQPLPEEARCARCGYSLHALATDRCPECGQAFDRAAVLALLRGKPAKLPFDATAAKWLSAPPWWATAAALLAVATNFSLDRIFPGNSRIPSPFGIVLFSVAFATLLLKAVDRLKVDSRYDLSTAPKRRFGVNWVLLSLACLLYFPLIGNEIVMRSTFAICRPKMDALAKRVISLQRSLPDQRVGFYDACFICPTSDGMNFRIPDDHYWGFAYTTTGQPPGCRPYAESLGGGWYVFGHP